MCPRASKLVVCDEDVRALPEAQSLLRRTRRALRAEVDRMMRAARAEAVAS